MLTLEKTLKVERINGKLGGRWSKLKKGDTVEVCFEVNGHGGNSPTIDIYINGVYNHSPYARSFNEMCYEGKSEYCEGYGYVNARPKIELTEVLSEEVSS